MEKKNNRMPLRDQIIWRAQLTIKYGSRLLGQTIHGRIDSIMEKKTLRKR